MTSNWLALRLVEMRCAVVCTSKNFYVWDVLAPWITKAVQVKSVQLLSWRLSAIQSHARASLVSFVSVLMPEFLGNFTNHGFIPKITLPTRITDISFTLIDNIFCKLKDHESNTTSGILTHCISEHQP
jgi:hypothetical protein